MELYNMVKILLNGKIFALWL